MSMTESTPSSPVIRGATVTTEDGGRLNAFAKEPRMEIISDGASLSNSSRLLIISGAVLVMALMALSVAVS